MDETAKPGTVFVCGACGKRSRTRYGLDGAAIDKGWDVSCMMNAILVDEEDCNRFVTAHLE
jgi:hypothetical protein